MGSATSALRARLPRRLHRSVYAVLEGQVYPPLHGRTVVVGESPIRVLLVGGGVAIGLGVRTRAEALDGQLAAILSERTGRGVVVDTRISTGLRLKDTVEILGASGALTFDVVVFASSFRDALSAARRTTRIRRLSRVIEHVRSTGTSQTGVVLLMLPLLAPLLSTAREQAIADRRRTAFDEDLAQVAARLRTDLAVPPDPDAGRARQAYGDAAYYRACAEVVAPVVLDALPGRVRTAVRQSAPLD